MSASILLHPLPDGPGQTGSIFQNTRTEQKGQKGMLATIHTGSFLGQFRQEKPRVHKNVAVLIFSGEDFSPLPYVLCSSALAAKKLTVQETGTVSSLDIASTSPFPVFIPAGQYLKGGGQDRIAVASVVLAPHAKGSLPTRCVEKRRWNPQHGEGFSNPTGGSLAASTIAAGSSQVNQQETWESVSELTEMTGTRSPSECLGDVQAQTALTRAEYVQALMDEPLPEHAVGALFVVGGPQGRLHTTLDVFGTSKVFHDLWKDLCESVALTAAAFSTPQASNMSDEAPLTALRNIEEDLKKTSFRPESIPVNDGIVSCGHLPQDGTAAVLEHFHKDMPNQTWILHLRVRLDS